VDEENGDSGGSSIWPVLVGFVLLVAIAGAGATAFVAWRRSQERGGGNE
jgi:hypothetical protein